MSIIKVKNLSKTYEYYKKSPGFKASLKSLFYREKLFTEAVSDISFEIEEGELIGFLGPNGAGKTTTLKMLSGILSPNKGKIEMLGYEPWKRNKDFQKQFALVMGQKNQLWWDLPPMDSFLLNKEIYEVDDFGFQKNLDELVELFDINDCLNVQVRKLSLGQRMKCELVAALLHKPKVLLLDEPTIGLDVIAQKNIREFIKKYNQNNKTTIVLTSHYMKDIKELCERVIVIDNGQIMYDGKLIELINKYASYKKLKIIFNGSSLVEKDLEKYGRICEFNKHYAVFEIERKNVKDIAAKILSSDLDIDDIEINEEGIDEIVRRMFKNNTN